MVWSWEKLCISLSPILIVFHLHLSLLRALFPLSLHVNILKVLLPSPILASPPVHLNLLDLITLTILGEQYKL